MTKEGEKKFDRYQYIIPKFESSVLFVKDVEKSKDFYSNLLGQKIKMDFGRNVLFEGGFAIWQTDYALKIIFSNKAKKKSVGQNNAELYFEYIDLKGFLQKLEKLGIEIIHGVKEHPWGQRAIRFYDLDNHIIEFGEPLFNTVIRLFEKGLAIKSIAEKTMLPLEAVQDIIKGKKD